MSNTSYYITGDGITVIHRGSTKTFPAGTDAFDTVRGFIIAQDMEGLGNFVGAFDPAVIGDIVAQIDGCEVHRDRAFIDGEEVGGVFFTRLIETARARMPIEPLVLLYRNLMTNPSFKVVKGFFNWLDHNHLAYTPDGHFLAYKIVNPEFKDFYTRTFDNSPGKLVEMPRNRVNDDPSLTCAEGLHGCGLEYLPQYHSHDLRKIICIKVNPADLVAFTSDCGHSKFRCARYIVLEEIPEEAVAQYFASKSVYDRWSDTAPVLDESDSEEDEIDEEDEDEDDGEEDVDPYDGIEDDKDGEDTVDEGEDEDESVDIDDIQTSETLQTSAVDEVSWDVTEYDPSFNKAGYAKAVDPLAEREELPNEHNGLGFRSDEGAVPNIPSFGQPKTEDEKPD